MKAWKKAMAALAALPMLMALAPSAAIAQDGDATAPAADAAAPKLLASWDFTGKNGTNSGSIADSTGTYNLTLNGGVSVGEFGDRNMNEALNLNNDSTSAKYAQIDDQLFKDAGDSFTLEFAAKSRQDDGDAFFSFAVGKDYNKYFFNRISTTKVKTVISDNKWNNEQGDNVAVTDNNNKWHNYKIVVDGTNLGVWRDGALLSFKANTGIKMSDLGGYTTYIGRSFYDGSASGIGTDKYWNGAIDDIKVYQGADLKAPTAVAISGTGVVDGKLAITEKDTTKLTATVTPDDAVSKDVTWSSSNEAVAKVAADGTITAVKAGEATITATTAVGGVKAELPVTVNPLNDETAATADLDAAISSLKTPTDENLPLVATGAKNGSDITWSSADEKLITGTNAEYTAPANGMADPYKGAGVVTRPAYGDGDSKPVELTATATRNGKSVTKKVSIVVKEKTRSVPDGAYASVTFLSDAATTNGKIGEALYESATDGNNFFSFSEINNSNPVIVSNTDTKGLRDPYVLKSKDGDKFYMIATDLKVSSMGWGTNQQRGSLKVEVWESTDMVNWTRTNAEDGDTGITVNAANMGMTWAPEAFWSDELNSYVVFWSSREYTDDTRDTAVKSTATGNAYNIVMMATTRDFRTFTPAQKWQDTQYSRIDSTVFKIGDTYYRLTKNEESGAAGQYITTRKSTFLERSKCLTCTTTSADPNANIETTWQLVDQNILPFEGPESIKLNAGDPNQNEAGDAMIIMADSGGYKPYMTSESALTASSWTNRLSQTDGWNTEKQWGPGVTGKVTPTNMPTPTRHGAFVNVSAAIAENMHNWTTENPTTLAAVDSTTTAAYDAKTREVTATVKAADEGTLAGNVVFTAGDWSQSVKVVDGVAKVTLPGSVSGTVKVAYDGYTDGLVKASQAEVTGVEYVKSSDASLKSLTVAGVSVDVEKAASAEGASVEVADPSVVTKDDVEAAPADAKASAEVAVADSVVTVTVTAEDGTQKVYKVALVKKAEPKPALRFTDVTAATPHAGDIQWLADRGISTGWPTGEGTAVFSPMGPVVRQDMAAFLYRLAGSPEFTPSAEDRARFTDVDESTPHYREVLWLASTGIADGFKQADGSFQFGGNRAVVRQDMAAFLKRLADYQKADPALGEGVAFTDVDARTPHADDIQWLARTGVAGGFGDGTFGGMRLVVRQDMAAFLHRMDTNVLTK